MNLIFSYQVKDGKVLGRIQSGEIGAGPLVNILDQQMGISFASDGALTHQEQRQLLRDIAALQHSLTMAIEEILDAAPRKEARYVTR